MPERARFIELLFRVRRWALGCVWTLAVSGLSLAAHAQPTELVCGSLVSDGSIDAQAEVDPYVFSGEEEDVVLITLTGFQGFFGEAPQATVLEASTLDQVAAFTANSQQPITLPATGDYVVRIEANDHVSTGAYSIGLECLKPLVAEEMPACGDVFTGALDADAEVDLFTFCGDEGDVSLLTLTGFQGFFGEAPKVTVLEASSLDEVVTFTANSQQPLGLPATDCYLVGVQANDLVSTGSYSLGFECLAPLATPDDTLECGDLLARSLDGAAEVDLITFSGSEEDIVALTLTGFQGFFGEAPEATVVRESNLEEVAAFQANSQTEISLPATDTYVVGIQANDLVSTGSYSLGLECLDPLSASDGMLSCGQPLASSLDASAEVDLLTFASAPGDNVRLTLTGFQGFFGEAPQATVLCPDEVVAPFDANGFRDFEMPVTGSCVIKVQANDLVATGQYSVNAETLPFCTTTSTTTTTTTTTSTSTTTSTTTAPTTSTTEPATTTTTTPPTTTTTAAPTTTTTTSTAPTTTTSTEPTTTTTSLPTTTTTSPPTTTTTSLPTTTTTSAPPTTTTTTTTSTSSTSTTTTTLPGGLVLVCHKGTKTKLLPDRALAAHLGHGDLEGFCPDEGAALVCHKGKKTRVFGGKALDAHVRHGDALGGCAP